MDLDQTCADEVSENPHEQLASKADLARVRTAIQRLPAEYREIVLLREYAELSYQEIARFLKCPVGTVMSRLGRARSKLRELLSVRNSSMLGARETTK